MKKMLAWLLAAVMMLSISVPAFAEETNAVVVGATTQMSGHFFTDLWGNNTSDMDVRGLIHGYATIAWVAQGAYEMDPVAVEEITFEDDENGNRTYTIKIQKDLCYNDGTQITAKDYVFSVLLQSSDEIAEIGATNMNYGHLLGHAAYAAGESDVLKGVRLVDDYTFQLTVDAGNLPYYYELALVNVMPYPAAVIAPGCEVKDDGEGAYLAGEFTAEVLNNTILGENGYLSHPSVSCGAYKLVSFNNDAKVAEFEVNPYFKGNKDGVKPSIAKITFKQVHNDTMLDELENGTVDLINKVTSGTVLTAAEQAGVKMDGYGRAGLAMLAFSCENKLTSSPLLRQALAYLVDRNALCEEFLKGYGQPVYSYYGLGQWMAAEGKAALNNLKKFEYSEQNAAFLLYEDGWTRDATYERYTLRNGTRAKVFEGDETATSLKLHVARSANNQAADIVEAQLLAAGKAVGFELEVTEMSMSELLSYYYRQQDRSEYDLFFLATNFSQVFDPYYNYHTDEAYQGVYNRSGLKDEKLMELAKAMRETAPGDKAAYLAAWEAFITYWQEAMPAVPLYSNNYYDLYTEKLTGYEIAPTWSWSQAIIGAKIAE